MPVVNTGLKTKLTLRTGEFMAALLLVQPLLDVLSYFMRGSGATVITTTLRLLLLITVSAYGFFVTDRKDLYAAAYAVIGGFWLLHMLSSLRGGYVDPFGDAAEYLKLIQLPLWTISFITLLRRRDGLDMEMMGILVVDLVIILTVIGLSYLTGRTAYTYEFPERGVRLGLLGWFGVPNAQSAVLSLIAPGVILWGLRTEKVGVAAFCTGMSCALLYFTGTRLTYYAAVLVCLGFTVLVLFCRKPPQLCIPLLAAVVLLLALKGLSPMEARQEISATSFAVYQEKIDAVMGEDKDFVYKEGEEIPPATLAKITALYEDVYGKQGVYGETLLEDLLQEFGTERVLKKFEYSVKPQGLNNSRIRKLKTLEMIWEDQDLLTRLLGLEYADATVGGHNYDPENDFPALFYYMGYLGTALYAAFLLGVLLYGVLSFVRRWPALLTLEFGAAAMMCAIGMGAAQLSGQVLRKPSVTVYISLGMACLYVQAREARPVTRLRPGHKRNPAVYIKKIEP